MAALRASVRTVAGPSRLATPLPRVLATAPRYLAALPVSQRSVRSYATKQVQHKAGSETLKDMKENAVEEIKGVKNSVMDVISGGQHMDPKDRPAGTGIHESFAEEVKGTLAGVTGLIEHVPRQAWIFGSAGLVPYVVTSLSTVFLARQAALASTESAGTLDTETALALLHHVENIQIAYGAIILSFLGALHWGMEFAKLGGQQGSIRYMLGTLPVLLAWPTLLVGHQVALAMQFGAFAVTWFFDMRATARGWTPSWYSTYRWALTTGVGLTILLSLIGSSLLGPGDGTPTAQDRMAAITEKQRMAAVSAGPGGAAFQGQTKSGVTVESGEEAYGIIRNLKAEKEAAEKKRQEEEAERKKAQGEEEKSKEAEEQDAALQARKRKAS